MQRRTRHRGFQDILEVSAWHREAQSQDNDTDNLLEKSRCRCPSEGEIGFINDHIEAVGKEYQAKGAPIACRADKSPLDLYS